MSFNLVAVAPVFRKIMCRPYSLYRSIYTIHVSWTTLDYPSAIRSWHCVTQECQEKRRGSRCRCGNCGYGLGRTVRNRPLFQVVTAEPTSKTPRQPQQKCKPSRRRECEVRAGGAKLQLGATRARQILMLSYGRTLESLECTRVTKFSTYLFTVLFTEPAQCAS